MRPLTLISSFIIVCMLTIPLMGRLLAEGSSYPRGPEITVMVGGLSSTEVQANVFKWQRGLRVDWARTKDTTVYTVLSFGYFRAKSNGEYTSIGNNAGPDFSEAVLKDIAECKAGDDIYIDDILIKTSSGEVLKMGALIYKLI